MTKLNVMKRTGTKKSEIQHLRRDGKIPAVLYSPKRPGETLSLDAEEFKAVLRGIVSGRLATTKFTLQGDKEVKAIIKDIQYHPTTYQIMHIDFEELLPNVPVNVNIPIECKGVADCPGIKLGGFLRQVIRKVKVECPPDNIPEMFEVDVRELGIRQSKRLSDIQMPTGVKPLAPMDEVVVVIAKR